MGGIRDFDPERDIPSLQGKVILITGGNVGLGKQSALDLSKHQPSEIWLAARNASKAEAAVAEVKKQSPDVSVHFLELDLASFESIKAAARKLLACVSRLDILLLNAGVMALPSGLTKEGYEIQFGTNHMGHALLLKLLTPLLIKTTSNPPGTDVRVVSLSSVAHKFSVSGGLRFDTLKTAAEDIATNSRYGQSKLANLLYAREVAKRYPQITTVSVHPGTVKTDLQKSGDSLLVRFFQTVVVPFIGVTVEEGAKSQLWAATAKGVISGEYYEPVGVLGKGSAQSQDMDLSKKLWEWTAKELEGQEI